MWEIQNKTQKYIPLTKYVGKEKDITVSKN